MGNGICFNQGITTPGNMLKIHHIGHGLAKLGFLGAFAASAAMATGCGQTWPSVRPMGDAQFMGHLGPGIATVDVLPMDVEISSDGRATASPDEIEASFDDTAMGAI